MGNSMFSQKWCVNELLRGLDLKGDEPKTIRKIADGLATSWVNAPSFPPKQPFYRLNEWYQQYIFSVYGVLPAEKVARGFLLMSACKDADDDLAIRLIECGVDPFEKEPRCWSAATYIRKNREDMPQCWDWLSRREKAATNVRKLERVASKARKRSWASGALVEPRAL